MAVYTSNSFGSLLSTSLKYTAAAGVIAALINAGLFFLIGIPNDEGIQSPDGTLQHIGVGNFITMSVIPSLIAGFLFAVLAKFVPRPFLIFNVIATLIFMFMFFGPFDKVANASAKTLILLQVAHVVVACAVLYALNNVWGAEKNAAETV